MALGMTQEQFAEAIDVSRTYLQSIEAGKANPTIEIADRIRKTCDCSWGELLDPGSCPDSAAKHASKLR